MSNPKKKIGLKATNIRFTNFSIIYDVKFAGISSMESGVVLCNNDIADKDLILKPTFINEKSMEVIFTPSNVTPHFYQSIFEKTIRSIQEYAVEKKQIYDVGDIVGFILL